MGHNGLNYKPVAVGCGAPMGAPIEMPPPFFDLDLSFTMAPPSQVLLLIPFHYMLHKYSCQLHQNMYMNYVIPLKCVRCGEVREANKFESLVEIAGG